MTPIRVGILTVSDRSSRGQRDDLSGPAIVSFCAGQGWEVSNIATLPDEQDQITELLAKWADAGDLDLIFTSGGTGFAPRDVTPEATLAVLQKRTPGIDEMVRAHSTQFTPFAALSRATSGIRGHCFILNLPGNPKAVNQVLSLVAPLLPHAVALLQESPPDIVGH